MGIFNRPKWKDVLTFRFDGACLLQGRKFKNGKTQFRVVTMCRKYGVERPDSVSEDILKQAGLWEQ